MTLITKQRLTTLIDNGCDVIGLDDSDGELTLVGLDVNMMPTGDTLALLKVQLPNGNSLAMTKPEPLSLTPTKLTRSLKSDGNHMAPKKGSAKAAVGEKRTNKGETWTVSKIINHGEVEWPEVWLTNDQTGKERSTTLANVFGRHWPLAKEGAAA